MHQSGAMLSVEIGISKRKVAGRIDIVERVFHVSAVRSHFRSESYIRIAVMNRLANFGEKIQGRRSKGAFVSEFAQKSVMPVSAEELLAWHSRPGAFERLLPPWENIEIIRPVAALTGGAEAELAVRIGPFRKQWIAQHDAIKDGIGFQDVQVSGPFAKWEHTHRMTPIDAETSSLEDRIQYDIPLGWLGRLLAGASIKRSLVRTFAYRHRVTLADLTAHRDARKRQTQGNESMKILVTGATGLVGSAVVAFLTTGGHRVLRLVRGKARNDDDVVWDPAAETIDAAKLEGLDAVVHLAGENIATGRWNAAKKAKIRDSRVNGTRFLSNTLAKLTNKPRTFVCASAIGFYGDRGDEVMTESSPPGTSFLCQVCRDWEAAAESSRQAGIRVVHLRIGVVLTPHGGALEKMLLPFKFCAGGVIGNGKQFMSWIALDDVVGAIHHALTCETLSGSVNAVAPDAVTNRAFTKTLGSVLHRPTIFPMPAFAARLAFGEMGDELLLASTRVTPQRLLESGYQFRCPKLDGALRHLLGK